MRRGIYFPLSFVVGETVDFGFDIKEDGEVIDLTVFTFAGDILGSASPGSLAKFVFEEDDTDPYVMRAKISADKSKNVPAGRFNYEIRMQDPDGNVVSLFYGDVEVNASLVLEDVNVGAGTSSEPLINVDIPS